MLLQQYLIELMDAGQHSLLPVYACHLRADERREVSLPRLSAHESSGIALHLAALVAACCAITDLYLLDIEFSVVLKRPYTGST